MGPPGLTASPGLSHPGKGRDRPGKRGSGGPNPAAPCGPVTPAAPRQKRHFLGCERGFAGVAGPWDCIYRVYVNIFVYISIQCVSVCDAGSSTAALRATSLPAGTNRAPRSRWGPGWGSSLPEQQKSGHGESFFCSVFPSASPGRRHRERLLRPEPPAQPRAAPRSPGREVACSGGTITVNHI